ncbi:unnamed protein product [Brugia timori]|uniref:Ovule protein n=1 Tax=Brugia timori TaxID=42155 RepID=A0A0R3QZ92_9BILA|nr:unnamed protein product [Brugia timori]
MCFNSPDHVHPKSGMQKDTERRPDSDRCCYFNSFQNQFDSKFYRRNLGFAHYHSIPSPRSLVTCSVFTCVWVNTQ